MRNVTWKVIDFICDCSMTSGMRLKCAAACDSPCLKKSRQVTGPRDLGRASSHLLACTSLEGSFAVKGKRGSGEQLESHTHTLTLCGPKATDYERGTPRVICSELLGPISAALLLSF